MKTQWRFSGDSAVHTTINQNHESCGGEGESYEIWNRSGAGIIGSDIDSTTDINDRGSRRLMEITVGGIRKRNWNFGTSAEIQRRSSGDSAEIQWCTQQLTNILNSLVVKGGN